MLFCDDVIFSGRRLNHLESSAQLMMLTERMYGVQKYGVCTFAQYIRWMNFAQLILNRPSLVARASG